VRPLDRHREIVVAANDVLVHSIDETLELARIERRGLSGFGLRVSLDLLDAHLFGRSHGIHGKRIRANREQDKALSQIDTRAMSPTRDDRGADLRALAARRWRIGGALTALMMVAYFGFILLVAFAKPLAGRLAGDYSVGILVGASVIALAPILTAVYVRWANRTYDPAVKALRARGRHDGEA